MATGKYNDKWIYALVSIPLISVCLLGAGYLLIYSLLIKAQLPATNAIKLIAVLESFLIPGVTTKIFKTKAFQVVVIWIVLTFLAIVINKDGEGNQNVALMMHFLGFQMFATALSTIFVAVQLLKQKN